MNYSVEFEEGTLENFNKAIKYYEKISNELADSFHIEFWNKIDYLKINPLHYQNRYKKVRIAHLKRFPFGIHYIIDKRVIRVFKILHHKQYFK